MEARHERLLGLRLDGDITQRSGGAQLEAARSRLSRPRDIEHGKYALISHYASLVPQGHRPPAERNRVYKTMRLRVFAHRDGTLIADPG